MTSLILFDAAVRTALLPLTYARPVGDLRVGSLTIAEKWARQQPRPVTLHTQDYLQSRFPYALYDRNVFLDGSILPTVELVSLLDELDINTAYYSGGHLVLAYLDREASERFRPESAPVGVNRKDLPHIPLCRISHPADIFTLNGQAIREDFESLTVGRESKPLSPTNLLIGPADRLFIEEGVTLEGSTINCQDGPVYFGRGSTVLEGSLMRGPLAVGAGALVKMGAKIYGSTTIGPHCKVGGEINNVVFPGQQQQGARRLSRQCRHRGMV